MENKIENKEIAKLMEKREIEEFIKNRRFYYHETYEEEMD